MVILFSLSIVVFLSSTVFDSKHKEVYPHTDYFVESLESTYNHYGIFSGLDHVRFTENGKYQIFPMGRLINVKIMKEVPFSEYEDLREDLETHYKGDSRVNKVYICVGGTVMVDCRQ